MQTHNECIPGGLLAHIQWEKIAVITVDVNVNDKQQFIHELS